MAYKPSDESLTNVFWTQAAWFIDPVAGSDLNDGATAATPVKSYNGGVVARWGTTSPVLHQDTTLTWLSSQPVGGADPVVLTPVCAAGAGAGSAAVVMVQGLLDATTRVHSGVIPGGGLTAKNRATGQLLQVDLGFAATPGMLVHNTTAGKDSYAMVYKIVAGTTYAMAQPIAAIALPAPADTVVTEVDTWAVGDTFEIFVPTAINAIQSEPTIAALDAVRTFPNPVQFQNIAIWPADGIEEDAIFDFHYTSAYNCTVLSQLASGWQDTSDMNAIWVNCYCSGSAETFNDFFHFAGGVLTASAITPQMACHFDFDAIIDLTAIGIGGFKAINGPLSQGLVYVAGALVTVGEIFFTAASSYSGTSILWGPGSLDALDRSRIVYSSVATAAATFLNAGGLLINQSGTANPFDKASGAMGAAIAISPASLDAAFGAGGFGGRAVNPGGACFDGTSSL